MKLLNCVKTENILQRIVKSGKKFLIKITNFFFNFNFATVRIGAINQQKHHSKHEKHNPKIRPALINWLLSKFIFVRSGESISFFWLRVKLLAKGYWQVFVKLMWKRRFF